MKLVLDLKLNKKLEESDIIIFKDGHWIVTTKELFLDNVQKEIRDLEKEIEDFKAVFEDYKHKVNEKMKEYHNVLQVLTKENE